MLRALNEAGVKIDLVAGRGVGVATALFAAVDGGARLWEASGLWRSTRATRLYRWRPSLRAVAWALAAALAAVLAPAFFLVMAAVVYPVAFLLRLVGLEAGARLAGRYGGLLDRIFDPAALPTLLPRLVVLLLLGLVLTVLVAAAAEAVRSRRRRASGPLWWRVFGSPIDASRARDWFVDGLWQLVRGAAPIARPALHDHSRRYTELLAENLGQPGFREVVLIAHDVDGRRDLAFALLAEPYRRRFFRYGAGREEGRRALEALDLAGAAREHALDALAGALSLPVATEPHLIAFAPESPWRGETHRLADRPEAAGRLLEEVASAGAEQVVLVSAVAELAGPHGLSAGRTDARGRAGEYLTAAEAAAVRDAVRARAGLFHGLFQIQPAHNPLGPFDFGGCYDERSDRRQALAELADRGYEDAYRQFVDPVVGASGDRLEAAGQEREAR